MRSQDVLRADTVYAVLLLHDTICLKQVPMKQINPKYKGVSGK